MKIASMKMILSVSVQVEILELEYAFPTIS